MKLKELREGVLNEISLLDIKKFTTAIGAQNGTQFTMDHTLNAWVDIVVPRELLVDGHLPYKFGNCSGNFEIAFRAKDDGVNLPLTSTYGFPKTVKKMFTVPDASYTSMKGFPTEVGAMITTGTPLTSFAHMPVVRGDIVMYRTEIESFEGIPRKINGGFSFSSSKMSSLSGIDEYIDEINGVLSIAGITSSILGLLNIKGLQHVTAMTPAVGSGIKGTHKEAWEILNKHLKGDRDIFACQQELIEAGYEEYAQL